MMINQQIIAKLPNGQDGHIWQDENGLWYGEVSDPGDYCQGCAWSEEDPSIAIQAVLEECEYILSQLEAEANGLRDW
jgi:hypothetical protein